MLYRIFAILDVVLIIKRILLVRKVSKNTAYYASHLFCLLVFLVIILTFGFIVMEFPTDSGRSFYNTPFSDQILGPAIMLYVFIIYICASLGLFIVSRKYATYNIVYNKKVRRKKQTVNLEESYIILHKMFGDKKIFVRDIVVEESCYYMIDGPKSKLFPNASIYGIKEYMILKLTNGQRIKIQNNDLILEGEGCALLDLTKALDIERRNRR